MKCKCCNHNNISDTRYDRDGIDTCWECEQDSLDPLEEEEPEPIPEPASHKAETALRLPVSEDNTTAYMCRKDGNVAVSIRIRPWEDVYEFSPGSLIIDEGFGAVPSGPTHLEIVFVPDDLGLVPLP